jgi:hypothetical protein
VTSYATSLNYALNTLSTLSYNIFYADEECRKCSSVSNDCLTLATIQNAFPQLHPVAGWADKVKCACQDLSLTRAHSILGKCSSSYRWAQKKSKYIASHITHLEVNSNDAATPLPMPVQVKFFLLANAMPRLFLYPFTKRRSIINSNNPCDFLPNQPIIWPKHAEK